MLVCFFFYVKKLQLKVIVFFCVSGAPWAEAAVCEGLQITGASGLSPQRCTSPAQMELSPQVLVLLMFHRDEERRRSPAHLARSPEDTCCLCIIHRLHIY